MLLRELCQACYRRRPALPPTHHYPHFDSHSGLPGLHDRVLIHEGSCETEEYVLLIIVKRLDCSVQRENPKHSNIGWAMDLVQNGGLGSIQVGLYRIAGGKTKSHCCLSAGTCSSSSLCSGRDNPGPCQSAPFLSPLRGSLISFGLSQRPLAILPLLSMIKTVLLAGRCVSGSLGPCLHGRLKSTTAINETKTNRAIVIIEDGV